LIKAVGQYDSFDMNMHKWLLTNFDVSCLYVQERKHLINAFSLTHSYVKNAASDSGLVFDYRDPSPKLPLSAANSGQGLANPLWPPFPLP
jgi:hypothetical protein